jgi:hypothetical protein
MKTGTDTQPRQRVYRFVQEQPLQGPKYSITQVYQVSTSFNRAIVTASAILQGNHKTPLPWTYTIIRHTPCRGRDHRYTGLQPNGTWSNIEWTGEFASDQPNPSDGSVGFTSLYNRGLSRLGEAIRGSLDLSVSIAEAGSTIRMLNAAKRLNALPIPSYAVRFASQVPSPVLKALKRFGRKPELALRQMGAFWLEFNLGWRPLIGDIYASADESLRVVLNRIQQFKAGASDKLSRDVPLTLNYSVPGTGFTGSLLCNCAIRGKHGVRFKVSMDVPIGFDISRWTSLNPVSIAWELVPLSFVVDYIIDIGSWLRCMENGLLFNNRFKSGYYEELRASRKETKGQAAVSGNYGGFDIREMSLSREDISYRRVLLTSYPFPKPPSFEVDLGSSRLLTIASLLSQKLK